MQIHVHFQTNQKPRQVNLSKKELNNSDVGDQPIEVLWSLNNIHVENVEGFLIGVVKEILKIRHFAPKNVPIIGDINILVDIGKMLVEVNKVGTKVYGVIAVGS